MTTPREQIYSALLTVLQSALLSPAGPFKTVGRRWQDPSQLSPADRPALYQVQKDELAKTSNINSIPITWRATVDLAARRCQASASLPLRSISPEEP
jgi:hypothetical protein